MQIHLYNVHSSKHVDGEGTGPPAIISQLENTTERIVGILHLVSNKLRERFASSATAQREEEMDMGKNERQIHARDEECLRNKKSTADFLVHCFAKKYSYLNGNLKSV